MNINQAMKIMHPIIMEDVQTSEVEEFVATLSVAGLYVEVIKQDGPFASLLINHNREIHIGVTEDTNEWCLDIPLYDVLYPKNLFETVPEILAEFKEYL